MRLYMLYKYNNSIDKDEKWHWQYNTAVAKCELWATIALVNEGQQGSDSGDLGHYMGPLSFPKQFQLYAFIC